MQWRLLATNPVFKRFRSLLVALLPIVPCKLIRLGAYLQHYFDFHHFDPIWMFVKGLETLFGDLQNPEGSVCSMLEVVIKKAATAASSTASKLHGSTWTTARQADGGEPGAKVQL